MLAARRFFLYLVLTVICGAQSLAQPDAPKPVLISQPDSTRAIALEATTFTNEPFSLTPLSRFHDPDPRTRILLFALNLNLQSGEDLTAVTADAEDIAHRRYSLRVEFIGEVPGEVWMKQVTLRLNDDFIDPGDVLIGITYRGMASNRVRVGIGHVGGGPPDDSGAGPTPAPPYNISGQIKLGGIGLAGVSVRLSGAQAGTLTTDNSGSYSFTVNAVGDYALTPSKTYYNFAPLAQVFDNLSTNQSNINFTSARQNYAISGQVRDDNDQAIASVQVMLQDENALLLKTTVTGANGDFQFTRVPAGFSYVVAPVNTKVFTFASQNLGTFTNNLSLAFKGARRKYTISGRTLDEAGKAIGGIPVTLSGSKTGNATTDITGNFSFASLPAGRAYTVNPSTTVLHNLAGQSVANLSDDQTLNFVGILRTYTISGQVRDDNDQVIAGIEVILKDENALPLKTTITGNSGDFEYAGVRASYSYLVTASSTSLFNFTTQNTGTLSGNLTLGFKGVRRGYTISGRALDQENHPISGVPIILSGSQTGNTTTDSVGNYFFGGLPAGFDYAVTPPTMTTFYTFAGQRVANLISDTTLNFQGVFRIYTISGRVVDNSEKALLGITVTVSGTSSDVAKTAIDGSFSFSAKAKGNYTITPSIEQGYYAFAPANPTIEKLGDNQLVGFTATLAPIPSPISVLEFDGTPMTVDHGPFWPGHIDLGPFFWEFWAMPGENSDARYILSDGYGGAHALLFGFIGGSEPGRYNLFGNIWKGDSLVYFYSDTGPAPGEWGHFAVGWDGKNILTYFNGVPVGKVAFNGPRQTLGPGDGSGRLLIGGSDHQNVVGRIAQVRGYEDTNPRAVAPESAFTPEPLFSVDGDFLSYYLRSSSTLADLSRAGHLGVSHPGTLRGVALGFLANCPTCPVPKFVVDPKAPNFANPGSPGLITAPVGTAPPVPEDARVFDSFSRQNSTYILGGIGGLGSTEGGALGPVAWQSSPTIQGRKPFGILNGRAVPLADNFSVAWVQPAASSALLVQSDRQNATYGSGVDTSVAFRVQDADNFWFAYTHDNGTKLSLGYNQAGVRTDVATYNMPTTWTTLRVSTSPGDGAITILVGNSIQVASIINTTMKSNQGCGIFNKE